MLFLHSCVFNGIGVVVTQDLKHLCECAASGMLNNDNIGKMLLVADDFKADVLRDSCKEYVTDNLCDIRDNDSFRQEVKCTPELALHLLDALPERSSKRRRVEVEHDVQGSSTAGVVPGPPLATVHVADGAPPSYALSALSSAVMPQVLPF